MSSIQYKFYHQIPDNPFVVQKDEDISKDGKIYHLPMACNFVGILMIAAGNGAFFPFVSPLAESVGLTGYQPAIIISVLNLTDLSCRLIGGWLARYSVRKNKQTI